MQLWDYRYPHCLGMYKGHDASISSLKYSPDGLWIASGDEDGSVKVNINLCINCVVWIDNQNKIN